MASGNDHVVLLGHCCFWFLFATSSVEKNKRNPWHSISVLALSQLSALNQLFFLRQTGVDMDAAALSPVHLASSYEMLMAFLGHYLRIDPLYFYQVVGHMAAAFSLPFVLYWCARWFELDRWAAAIGAFLGIAI